MAKIDSITVEIFLDAATDRLAEAIEEVIDYAEQNPWCGLAEHAEIIKRAVALKTKD